MKRINSLVLALSVLALVLAACGPGVAGPLPGDNSQASTEGVASPLPQSEAGGSPPATASGTRVIATMGLANATIPAPSYMGGQLNTPTPSPFDQLPAYVNAARKWLAGELPVPASKVNFVAEEAAEWSDSCLGLGKPNESCAQAVTPGHKITFEVDGTQYVVRTDETAEVVRLEK